MKENSSSIEYIYNAEIQRYINSLKAEIDNLKIIYFPLIEKIEKIDIKDKLLREYLNKSNILINQIAKMMNEATPIAIYVNGKIWKYENVFIGITSLELK